MVDFKKWGDPSNGGMILKWGGGGGGGGPPFPAYPPPGGGGGAILGNGYGVQGQNYVVLLQGSEVPAGFHYRNLILAMFLVNHIEHGLMVSKSEFQSSDPRLFPRREEYEIAFQF